jgi:hypothetical protein
MPDSRGSSREIRSRKDDHLDVATRAGSLHTAGTGLRRYRLRHRALPGRDLADVDLATAFLGARLAAPLMVSAMTGGTERARRLNERLAGAAAAHGLSMGLGSGRALLADPSLLPTYRASSRPPLLLANLGAVQLRLGVTPADAERLVDLLDADGLVLHLNPVQEAVQPGGEDDHIHRDAALLADEGVFHLDDQLAFLTRISGRVGYFRHLTAHEQGAFVDEALIELIVALPGGADIDVEIVDGRSGLFMDQVGELQALHAADGGAVVVVVLVAGAHAVNDAD